MFFRKIKTDTLISVCFLAYFLILFAERAQSLIRTFTVGIDQAFSTGFDIYVNVAALLSLVATVVLLVGWNGDFWRSVFHGTEIRDYGILCLTSGVILVSGMVHTEYTIAPIQFAAYGALILGMALRTVRNASLSRRPFMPWFSLVFVTAFSMAIPVMYRSSIPNARGFHILEAVVALALVGCFTFMLNRIFAGKADDLLFFGPMILAAVGDAIILEMRWQEEVNTFVLIFAVLSGALFVIGKILFTLIRKK